MTTIMECVIRQPINYANDLQQFFFFCMCQLAMQSLHHKSHAVFLHCLSVLYRSCALATLHKTVTD